MVSCPVKNSGNTDAVRYWTIIDDIIANREAAILTCEEFRTKLAHFGLLGDRLACLGNQVQKRVGSLPAAALLGNIEADFNQITIRLGRNFEPSRELRFLKHF